MAGKSLVQVLRAGLARDFRMMQSPLSGIPTNGGGWFGVIRESFGGAFQRNIEVDSQRNILAFSAVFACVTGIASDIAKLGICLYEDDKDDIKTEVVDTSPYWPLFRRPNRYQTIFKFVEQWIVSKLLYGNTYALKQRDSRGIVTALYILDPQRVKPLVATDGGVYYELSPDHLSGLPKTITVPAKEIIHDTMVSLWHPLVGVSPIFACGMSATMGNRIQSNSTKFFDNMSRPSGMLSAPGTIAEETAKRLKSEWETNFGGNNIGRLAVLGDGLTYEAMTIPAHDAQLIEQLKWTVEDVARCFRYPNYKLGGSIPVGSTVETLNLGYYCDCLQPIIEAAEGSLEIGLGLDGVGYYAEFEVENLLRMDMTAQMKVLTEGVKGTIYAPNEARAKIGLKPVDGGASPMAQQQNFSLAALAKRDALPNPFVIDRPAANPTPSSDGPPTTADPAANDANAKVAALADAFIRGMQSPMPATAE